MKSRKIIYNPETGKNNLVFFGSYGKTSDGNGLYELDDHSSYDSDQAAIASNLIYRLSILKGEIWYLKNYGLPLLNKIKDKDVMDSIIINIILEHPAISFIVSYKSSIDNAGNYNYSFVAVSKYNKEITISNSIGSDL